MHGTMNIKLIKHLGGSASCRRTRGARYLVPLTYDIFMHNFVTIAGQGTPNPTALIYFIRFVSHVGSHITSIICTALYLTLTVVLIFP